MQPFDVKKWVKNNMSRKRSVKPLMDIHYKFVELFHNKHYATAGELIREFNENNPDIGRLRSILIICKSFKENENLKGPLKKTMELLQSKVDKPIV